MRASTSRDVRAMGLMILTRQRTSHARWLELLLRGNMRSGSLIVPYQRKSPEGPLALQLTRERE
jgi:hypothetical protein